MTADGEPVTDPDLLRVSLVRVVIGRDWLQGKHIQDREKKVARDAFDAYVRDQDAVLVSAVRETIAFNEKQRQVEIIYSAEAKER